MLYRLSYTRVKLTIAFAARFATGLAAGAPSQQQIALSGRISDDAAGANHGRFRHAGRLQMPLAHDVDHRIAYSQEVIGNDAPVASPPDSLRAKNRANLSLSQRTQLVQAAPEFLRRGIIRLIAEILVVPKAVRRALLPVTQAAERRHVPVADPGAFERVRDRFGVELRIVPRLRDGAHVGGELHAHLFEKADELLG